MSILWKHYTTVYHMCFATSGTCSIIKQIKLKSWFVENNQVHIQMVVFRCFRCGLRRGSCLQHISEVCGSLDTNRFVFFHAENQKHHRESYHSAIQPSTFGERSFDQNFYDRKGALFRIHRIWKKKHFKNYWHRN